jgi:hypothetical protein
VKEIRFKIGDKAWVASCSNSPKNIICPDCLGEGRLLVTMGDKTTHSIECTGCARGYEAPIVNFGIDPEYLESEQQQPLI